MRLQQSFGIWDILFSIVAGLCSKTNTPVRQHKYDPWIMVHLREARVAVPCKKWEFLCCRFGGWHDCIFLHRMNPSFW